MGSQLLSSCLLFTFIPALYVGCNGGQYENKATESLSTEDKMRYEQYMVHGQTLYHTHCSNCHQEDGTGLGRLIPPLAKSDFMIKDVGCTICIIKYGMEGQVIVNNNDYHHKMPANETLKDIEIAQITTFIYNSWGNQHGYIGVKEVRSYLESCQ